MESEISPEEKLDRLLDESFQIKSEVSKIAVLEKIKELFEQLNGSYEQKEKTIQCKENKKALEDFKQTLKDYSELSMTISCIELTMKHDIRGNVIDWMDTKNQIGYSAGVR